MKQRTSLLATILTATLLIGGAALMVVRTALSGFISVHAPTLERRSERSWSQRRRWLFFALEPDLYCMSCW